MKRKKPDTIPEDSEESSVLCVGMEECRCKSLIEEPLVHPQVDRMMQYECFYYYSLLYDRKNKALLLFAYT